MIKTNVRQVTVLYRYHKVVSNVNVLPVTIIHDHHPIPIPSRHITQIPAVIHIRLGPVVALAHLHGKSKKLLVVQEVAGVSAGTTVPAAVNETTLAAEGQQVAVRLSLVALGV